MALEAVVMCFLMEETVYFSVASLFGVGGTGKAKPVRSLLSWHIFQIIPKEGGLGRN